MDGQYQGKIGYFDNDDTISGEECGVGEFVLLVTGLCAQGWAPLIINSLPQTNLASYIFILSTAPSQNGEMKISAAFAGQNNKNLMK